MDDVDVTEEGVAERDESWPRVRPRLLGGPALADELPELLEELRGVWLSRV